MVSHADEREWRRSCAEANEGDICYTAAMELIRAYGILTTNDVAIVAREMKKPCIIGTKIATQVLEDGDMVEVDAEKGVVRILERLTT